MRASDVELAARPSKEIRELMSLSLRGAGRALAQIAHSAPDRFTREINRLGRELDDLWVCLAAWALQAEDDPDGSQDDLQLMEACPAEPNG